MNRLARGRLDVEISRHRAVIKTWVIKRIADTPVFSEDEMEARAWFHDLRVDERSTLITDLARLSVKGVDLYKIAKGPLGVLYTRFPQLFEGRETYGDPIESEDDPTEEMAVMAGAMSNMEAEDSAWYSEWRSFDRDLEGPVWPVD